MQELPPSVEAAILEYCSDEVMRLQLPLTPPRVAVQAVHAAWERALLTATPAGQQGLHVPISTVEHENEQLSWGRPKVPLCKFGQECDALRYGHAPGPLPVYLSIGEQERFDADGHVPEGALFCLLCIRRDAQALYLAHHAATDGQLTPGQTTFCVPPFQNLVDCPGGYVKSALSVPPNHSGMVPVSLVGVSSELSVMHNPYTDSYYIDQGRLVYGARLNGQPAAR